MDESSKQLSSIGFLLISGKAKSMPTFNNWPRWRIFYFRESGGLGFQKLRTQIVQAI